jgi:hypothetical protein
MSCAATILLYNLRWGAAPTILDVHKRCDLNKYTNVWGKTHYVCDYIDINREVVHLTKSQIDLYALTGDRTHLCTNELGDKGLYDIHTITPSL